MGYDDISQAHGRWLFEFLAFPEQSASILHGLREQGSWMGQAAARRRDCSVFPAEISAHWIGGKRGNAGWVHWRIVDLTGRLGVEYEELRRVIDLAWGRGHHVSAVFSGSRTRVAVEPAGFPCR